MGAGVGIALMGGAIGGMEAVQENEKKKEEKANLERQYRHLVSLYSPIRNKLLASYMPGGEFSQRLAGLNREKANLQRYGGESAARANAYRTGGIRSGAVDRGRRGSWLNLMTQGQTSADMEALSRLAAQDLASKGAQIRAYQYPGFGSRLAGAGEAFVEFGRGYDRNNQPETSGPER